jgi:hypothetical protein
MRSHALQSDGRILLFGTAKQPRTVVDHQRTVEVLTSRLDTE